MSSENRLTKNLCSIMTNEQLVNWISELQIEIDKNLKTIRTIDQEIVNRHINKSTKQKERRTKK